MMGTQNHEGIAGAIEAIEYLADVGRSMMPNCLTRRDALMAAYDAISEHESSLVRRLIEGLADISGINVWGISDPERVAERVPTVALTHNHATPQQIAGFLGERGIFTWAGNFYAPRLVESLGLEMGGLLRIGLLHYNTEQESGSTPTGLARNLACMPLIPDLHPAIDGSKANWLILRESQSTRAKPYITGLCNDSKHFLGDFQNPHTLIGPRLELRLHS